MVGRKAGRADRIAGQILSLARRDGLLPGARLIEEKLAADLAVSRGPVRSALKQLAESGVVTGIPNRGYILALGTETEEVAVALAAAEDSERHYRAIAGDRLDGHLPETVTEAELMRRYDIGRPDLCRSTGSRQRMDRRLRAGWRCAETLSSADAYRQAAQFRCVIEPAAILEPMFHLESDVIATLRKQQQRLLDGAIGTMSQAEVFQIGCAFHEAIARASGNRFYVEALRRVNSIRRLFVSCIAIMTACRIFASICGSSLCWSTATARRPPR
jgi:DNA-binding GntR family transcriptional regulator